MHSNIFEKYKKEEEEFDSYISCTNDPRCQLCGWGGGVFGGGGGRCWKGEWLRGSSKFSLMLFYVHRDGRDF